MATALTITLGRCWMLLDKSMPSHKLAALPVIKRYACASAAGRAVKKLRL
jgi:hypothetical protein